MQTIEQLKTAQAAQISALTAQLALSEAAPLVPDSVMLGKVASWLTYRKRTLSEALDIFKAYTVAPMYEAKNSCTEIAPESCYHGKNMTVKRGPFALSLTVDMGEGYGANVKVTFYGMAGDTLARVCVDIEGPDYIGMFHALAPTSTVQRAAQGRGEGRIVSRQFDRNTLAASLADHVVSWSQGSGPIKTSASHTYLFSADDDQTAPGAQHRHACDQLQNLIDLTTKAGA
jgi:hypothetical protein